MKKTWQDKSKDKLSFPEVLRLEKGSPCQMPPTKSALPGDFPHIPERRRASTRDKRNGKVD